MSAAKKNSPEHFEFGMVTLSEFLDDRIVYRDLQPIDKQYQGYNQCARDFGMDPADLPRKTDPSYAKVAVWITEHMQERRTDIEVEELLFIGDTYGTDGVAFEDMVEFSRWRGACFICSEDLNADPDLSWDEKQQVATSNRWNLLGTWLQELSDRFALDERTAVIIDLDKTALGARGRNSKVVNESRLESLHRALEGQLIGTGKFNFEEFRLVYDAISRPDFFSLTGDNQDYIVYICLMVTTGIMTIKEVSGLLAQKMSFDHLVRWISTQAENKFSMEMRQLHEQYQMCARNGDCTPFKQFRRQEFLNTVQHMGQLPADTTPDQRLAAELCITQEVRELSLFMRDRGSLILSLSDKPHESAMPHPRWHKGMQPIHRVFTHAVGTSIQPTLDTLGS